MRRLPASLALLLLLGGVAVAGGKLPPPPSARVTNLAGFLSPGAERGLDARLEAYERETGRQVLVYIGEGTGGAPVEEFCARAFEAWGVGKKGRDDGVVLFLFPGQRELRIEVGYGLEGLIPDATAFRIIDEIILPRIRGGDNDGAVAAGVEAILAAADGKPFGTGAPVSAAQPSGEPVPAPPPSPARGSMPLGQIIVLAILGIGFLILLVTHPSLALWLLFQILSAAAGGGGGGGGRGGWSGGGGRSGGGGASGRW